MTIEHELTERDVELLQMISGRSAGAFGRTIGVFMNLAIEEGFPERVAGAAFSVFLLSNLTKALLLCSGMPSEEINDDEVIKISSKAHEFLSGEVGKFIETGNAKRSAEMN